MGIRRLPPPACRPGIARVACLLAALLIGVPAAGRAQNDAEDIERLSKALGIGPGLSVAEIGAGGGALTLAMARAVGTTGHVCSSELGESRVDALRKAVEQASLPQISVLAGAPSATNLPEGCCDAVFMRVVYHHFADPATMNASLFRSLKPGGRLAIIEFSPRRTEAEKPEDRDEGDHHGVNPDTVVRELQQAGFVIVSNDPAKDRNFMVVARKP